MSRINALSVLFVCAFLAGLAYVAYGLEPSRPDDHGFVEHVFAKSIYAVFIAPAFALLVRRWRRP